MLLYAFPGAQLTQVTGTWTNVPFSTGGTITSLTVNRQEVFRLGQLCYAYIHFTITNNGTGATAIRVTMPTGIYAPLASPRAQTFLGREIALSGNQLMGVIIGTTMDIRNVNGTYPGATNRQIVVSGYYLAT